MLLFSPALSKKPGLETYILKGTDVVEVGDSIPLTVFMRTSDGLKVVEHFFDLPLDYSNPQDQTIRVFARVTFPSEKAKTEEEEDNLPYCVYIPYPVLLRKRDSLLSSCLSSWYVSRRNIVLRYIADLVRQAVRATKSILASHVLHLRVR